MEKKTLVPAALALAVGSFAIGKATNATPASAHIVALALEPMPTVVLAIPAKSGKGMRHYRVVCDGKPPIGALKTCDAAAAFAKVAAEQESAIAAALASP